jgi:hypothetical protein
MGAWSRRGFRMHDSVYLAWGWIALWIAGVLLQLAAIIVGAVIR